MSRLGRLTLCAFLLHGCSDKQSPAQEGEPRPPSTEKSSPPEAKSAPTQKEKQGNPPVKAKPETSFAGKVAVPNFAEHSMGRRSTESEFLGWSQDGSRFAIRSRHQTDWPVMDAVPADITLTQVYDAVSDEVEFCFQHEKSGPVQKSDLASKVWKNAQSKEEWKQWKKGKLEAKATTTLATDDYSFQLNVSGNSEPKFDQVSITVKKDHFKILWLISKGKSPKRKSPELSLSIHKGHEVWTPLVYSLPYRVRDFYEEIPEGVQIQVEGTIRIFPSPQEDRIALISNFRMLVDNEAFPGPAASHYVRTLGPQLKIVDSEHTAVARALAIKLREQGLTTTFVEHADEVEEEPSLYYRHLPSRYRASIKEILPTLKEEKLKKNGWMDGILILPKSKEQ